jgi:hypothetical protein
VRNQRTFRYCDSKEASTRLLLLNSGQSVFTIFRICGWFLIYASSQTTYQRQKKKLIISPAAKLSFV